ncbi:group II intron reverse transcriptase domain-containing protein [Candidatus Uhrbacteria bacterium]|nr:group II intron reverse transcriptase domain-containing protein [Candidatus Uhrbacteria bacterium]
MRGKWSRGEIHVRDLHLEDTIFSLHQELVRGAYRHGQYTSFFVVDPKVRHIHKASVRDRVVHHAVFRTLYPMFDRSFIFDSYSCRVGKGAHRAIRRLQVFLRKEGKNNTRIPYVLKCDIRRFFDSVDHSILLKLLKRHIKDERTLSLLQAIIGSFAGQRGKGIPLGNVTSQLFANIYLNELDVFMKHSLKAPNYVRYCDDFVVVSHDKKQLVGFISSINTFIDDRLRLELHPSKVHVRKFSHGIDFLGYVLFPCHVVLRVRTKKRVLKKIAHMVEGQKAGVVKEPYVRSAIQSYLSTLNHCNACSLKRHIKEMQSGGRF